MSEPMVALKGRFTAPNQRYHGIFLVLLNTEAGYIDTASIVAGMPGHLPEVRKGADWRTYDKTIQTAWYEQKIAQAITNDFQDLFKQVSMDQDFYGEISQAVKAQSIEKLKSSFYMIIQRVLRDENLEIDIDIEPIAAETLVEPEKETPESPKEEKPAEETVPINLSLAPVGGKPIGAIAAGDVIMAKPDKDHPRGYSIIKSLELETEKGLIRPIPMKVVNSTKTDTGQEIVARMEDGTLGRTVETERVLVQLYSAESSGRSGSKSSGKKVQSSDSEGGSMTMVYLVGGVILILLILLAILI